MTPLLLKLYKDKQISREELLTGLEFVKSAFSVKSREKIAVIGLSCRMPQANDANAFWENLIRGVDSVRPFPQKRRRDIDKFLPKVIDRIKSEKEPYWIGGFLDSIDEFDNQFFEILPADATLMDPQQRIFLELAHEALVDAGYTKDMLNGLNAGVFVGDVVNEYRDLVTTVTPSAVVGNISPFIASRVSYFYNLKGPAINVSTACSTSLVTIHTALQSLALGECDIAITGAINLRVFPFDYINDPVDALGITTSRGACRPFDDSADGVVRGEGGAVIIFKRYEAALRDGDHIRAVVLASGVNNDGKSSSVGAPNPSQQAELLKKTWKAAGISPENISYIEAHGTGTHIGDPIEVQGITSAMAEFTNKKNFCGLGSVKSNIGHLTGGASGIAGLMKLILSLQNKKLPPSLHFEIPNSLIDFKKSPIYVVDSPLDWSPIGSARIGGVSAFGFSGTNCHILVEEAPSFSHDIIDLHQNLPFMISAPSRNSLEKYTALIQELIAKSLINEKGLLDLSFTLLHRRDFYRFSLLFFTKSVEELLSRLERADLDKESQKEIDLQKIKREFPVSFFSKQGARAISLPAVPYEKKRFWIEEISPRFKERFDQSSRRMNAPCKNHSKAALLGIVQRITGYHTVSLEDHFFDLGGDSLIGVELLSDIHREMGVKLGFDALFANPRLSDLYAVIASSQQSEFKPIPKVEKQSIYSASWGQRRIFVLDQMQKKGSAYTIYDVLDIEGAIDEEKFLSALLEIVKRHEALRTTYSFSQNTVFQKIGEPKIDFRIVEIEATKGDVARIEKLLEKEMAKGFDLLRGPLLSAVLYKLSESSSILLFMLHHIAADGYSINLIIKELFEIYYAKTLGKIATLPNISSTYVDYTYWQESLFKSKKYTEQKQYWIERCTDLPLTYIRGDLPRPDVFSFNGARLSFQISAERQKILSKLGANHDATLFMVLVSAVNILIYQYTSERDLVIGTPVSGRSHKDLSSIVGFFVNTLLLKTSIRPDMTISKLLKETKEVVSAALDHQDYPFDLLVEDVGANRDTSRSPLFNINVAYHNFEGQKTSQERELSLSMKRRVVPHKTCKWDLEFEFTQEKDGSLSCFLEYYKDVYTENFACLLRDSLLKIISEISKADALVSQLSLASQSVVEGKTGTSSIGKNSVVLSFEKTAKKSPDAPAILHHDITQSYSEINRQANRLARLLQKISGERGKRIGILMESTPESVVALLAVHKAGASFVPIGYNVPEERVKHIVESSAIETLISTASKLKMIESLIWGNNPLKQAIFLDVDHAFSLATIGHSGLMNAEMWDSFAKIEDDQTMQSGWVSSYTGQPFSKSEMKEYSENVLKKVKPHLSDHSTVLEIGCGSGLTAFQLSPHVKQYIATDLSLIMTEKNREYAAHNGYKNMEFFSGHALEVAEHLEGDFDLIVLNSVVHCFPSLTYLEFLLTKLVEHLKVDGAIFLGDLMDSERKGALIESLQAYKNAASNKGDRTKLIWDNELFVPKAFLVAFSNRFGDECDLSITEKIGKQENELTRFRYDGIFKLRKSHRNHVAVKRKPKLYTLEEVNVCKDHNLPHLTSLEDEAYLLYTSGTTAAPKGVVISHRAFANYVSHGVDCYAENTRDFVYFTSLAYDLTLTSVFIPIVSGGMILCVDKDFLEVLEQAQKHDKSLTIKLTPSHLRVLLKRLKPITSFVQFILGGESFKTDLLRDLLHQYPDAAIYNEYGPTEATVGCILYAPKKHLASSIVPIGHPIDNTGAAILGVDQQVLPIGATGEIALFGESLSDGYIGSQRSSKRFCFQDQMKKSIYLTGDFGRLGIDGNFECFGRRDRQVKIRGTRIELEEIESALQSCKGVDHAAVVVIKKENDQSEMIAFFSGVEKLDGEELRQNLSTMVSSSMLPSKVIKLSQIPKSKSGKVDYRLLENHQVKKKETCVIASLEKELLLEEIWAECLGKGDTKISIDSDFFDLGGDSIIAMQLVQRLKEKGFHMNVTDIFNRRTIRLMAESLEEKKGSSMSRKKQPNQLPKEPFGLSPIQNWFLEQQFTFPEYFNMVFMFHLPAFMTTNELKKAFSTIIQSNSIFRLKFQLNGDQSTQIYANLDELNFNLKEFDLSSLSKSHQNKKITEISTQFQSSFHLEKPPLLRVARLKLAPSSYTLLVVMHHLIIDGVSWRFLVNDLSNCINGEEMQVKPKANYHEWIEYLRSLDYPPSCLNYWKSIDINHFPQLSNTSKKEWKSRDYNELRVTLNRDQTAALEELATAYGVNLNRLLLASVMSSMYKTFGVKQILINHEGHGRKASDRIDITRTYGWFTTIYPIALAYHKDFEKMIREIDGNVSKAAENDIYFSIERYLKKHLDFSCFQPQVLFNYFGKISGEMVGFKNLSDAGGELGSTTHLENIIPHLIEFNAIIIEETLRVSILINAKQLTKGQIASVRDEFLVALETSATQACVYRS